MIKNFLTLFKIGRNFGKSGTFLYLAEKYNIPLFVKCIFFIVSLDFKKKINTDKNLRGSNLCETFQEMGTTFIKLGQFLATRPDIIGEDVAKDLEKLQASQRVILHKIYLVCQL